MDKKKNRFLNKNFLFVAGILLVFLFAALLLWHGNANSSQAVPAMMAQVRFQGEYRIGDGLWQKITEDTHIPSTKGDVTLLGNFHMLAPDGEYVGIYAGDIPVALYTDHISLTIYEEGYEPSVLDVENPLYGDAACGEIWSAYYFTSTEPIRIVIHNPHSFGNETAIDALLENTAFWANIEFEKDVLASGETQRNIGLFFMIVALVLMGIALFSALIHIKNSKLLWLLGLVSLFAGIYFAYSATGLYFWKESVVSNTAMLGIAMMFYMLLLSVAVAYFLKSIQKVGIVTAVVLGAVDALFLLLPVATDIRFYDTWFYWAVAQILANLVLMICLIKEFFTTKGENRWLYITMLLPLTVFGADALLIGLGVFKYGVLSQCVFVGLFAVTIVTVLRIIPRGINAAAKAKALETEKSVLNAKLAESRISTMMSQIRPHFIYNTLGSIEQLCYLDPPKAGELVHNFAKYLRGNFGELDNPKPILMSKEMEHVHHYISIENVRFPDMTFSFEMNSVDFHIPALTIQPIVENAIKHGLMKLPKGGKIRVASYETADQYCVLVEDDGVGFDTGILLDERNHVGIRNIRGRLKAMVNGTLEIESTVGVGTKVRITIPKEVDK